jgi:hypothetical protein
MDRPKSRQKYLETEFRRATYLRDRGRFEKAASRTERV